MKSLCLKRTKLKDSVLGLAHQKGTRTTHLALLPHEGDLPQKRDDPHGSTVSSTSKVHLYDPARQPEVSPFGLTHGAGHLQAENANNNHRALATKHKSSSQRKQPLGLSEQGVHHIPSLSRVSPLMRQGHGVVNQVASAHTSPLYGALP